MPPRPASNSHAVGRSDSGFTIIELLITTFVIGTIVTGLFGFFVLSLRTAQESERRLVAVALANEKMELIRNLPYVNVGTSGGVPSGSILQEEAVDRNGLTYTVRTDIRYVDDPYDGQAEGSIEEDEKITICHKPGTAEEQSLIVSANALDAHISHGDTSGPCEGGEATPEGDLYTADYKQVRVEVSWNSPNSVQPVLLITYVTPQGIEGGELGGTLDFQALNAAGASVQGASVRIVNDAVDPPIDLTTETNAEGRVILPALPESADSYEITLTNAGHTTEQTYDETADFIPDSDHSHLSMILREVTHKTFFIDLVSNLNILTEDDTNTALGNIAYTIRGTKAIGVNGSAETVYLLNEEASTDVNGEASYTDLVWDSYDITIDGDATGYDIKETSVFLPVVLEPGATVDLEFTLVPHVPFSLHTQVASPDNEPVDNATVRLYAGAYDEELGTGVIGQVFFGDVPSAGDYTIEVTAPGYDAYTQTVPIDGTDRIRINLTPSA